LERILGSDKPNYLIAKVLVHQSDILLNRKKVDEAEKTCLRAQAMIGEIYSDNHPCIIDFNSNLVEVYASMQDEGQKKKTV
jgi:hypothetical protein